MAKLPDSFTEALKSGYCVIDESSVETQNGRRVGTLHLKNGSRSELWVSYEADARNGYRFGKPQREN